MPFNNDTQRKTAFFHALSYVLTDYGKDPANEKYKSSHSVRNTEVWTSNVAYAGTEADAITESNNNVAVTARLSNLYPLDGSNFQTWFFDNGTPTFGSNGYFPSVGFARPWISPVDIPSVDGNPSDGYKMKLYTPGSVQIDPSSGFWEVDYYAGFVKFQTGYTPKDSGNQLGFTFDAAQVGNISYVQNNSPIVNFYEYTGEFLSDTLSANSGQVGYYEATNIVPVTNSGFPIITLGGVNIPNWTVGSELEIEINGISTELQTTSGSLSSDESVYFSTNGVSALSLSELKLDGTENLYLIYDGNVPRTNYEIGSIDNDKVVIIYTKS